MAGAVTVILSRVRGGGLEGGKGTMSDAADSAFGQETEVLAVHEALEDLESLDRRQARIAELRFFAGLTTAEVAEVLGISTRSVELDWMMAKDWLAQRLRPE